MAALWLLAFVISMCIALISLRWGVALYLIGALVFPSLWIGQSMAVRFEQVFLLWLVFLLFVRKALLKAGFAWHPILSLYSLFLVAVMLATILALIGGSEGSLMQMFASFYGMARPLLVMFLVLNTLIDENFVSRILRAFLWLSIPIALLSIGQTLGVDIVQQITLHGYTSPSRSPVFALLEQRGAIIRATGVFESPVYNAVYWVLVSTALGFAILSGARSVGSKWFLYLLLGLAIVSGITTLSSTFLIGGALVLAMFVFLLAYRYPKRFFQFAIGGAGIVGLVLILVLPYLQQQQAAFAGSLNYQINRILSGRLLYTRYDPEGGNLEGTYQAIQQRPIIGWGLVEHERAFVGDSIYISVLYRGGIIGLGIFLQVIFSILKHAWRNRSQEGLNGLISWIVLLWTLSLLVTGVGSPSFFTLRLQEWYWALVGVSLGLYSRSYRSMTRYEYVGLRSTS